MMGYSVIKSPLGWLGVVGHKKGVVMLLRSKGGPVELTPLMRQRFPTARPNKGEWFRKTERFLKHYFRGKRVPSPPVDLSSVGSFQQRVLGQVRRVPYGEIRTYDWIAKRVRLKGGARACGRALHENPTPLLIPCHRIVPKQGGNGGFVWGEGVKRKLLRVERFG